MDQYIQTKLILFDSNSHIAKSNGRHMGVSQYQLQFLIRRDPNTHKHSLLHHSNSPLSEINGEILWDTRSWKGQLERTRNWKVVSWKVLV